MGFGEAEKKKNSSEPGCGKLDNGGGIMYIIFQTEYGQNQQKRFLKKICVSGVHIPESVMLRPFSGNR